MGCITSTNKLHEMRHDNVFRVRVAHLQPSGPDTPIIRSGYLELTPRELIFVTPGCEPIVWALQHLRRYGLNGDLFSFEAGRRCMSGPGIYTFRVHNAENLYPMFQRYINAVNTDAFAQSERERMNSTHSVLLGRTDANPHSNNYLEPAPMPARANVSTAMLDALSAQSGDPNSALVDSTDLLPNLQQYNGEPGALQSPITPGAYINTNIYFDQPLRALQEQSNNVLEGTAAAHNTTPPTTLTMNGTCSAYSTMRKRTLLKGCSLDMPPQETAPAAHMDTLHMYANVGTPSSCSLRERLLFDLPGSDRCYENVNRVDLQLLLQAPPQRETSQQSVTSICTSSMQQPATPTSLGGTSGINYIVLDLDQPRSPVQCSPKTTGQNGFGSGLSLSVAAVGGSGTFLTAQTAPVTPEAGAALDVPLTAQAQSLNSVSLSNADVVTNKAATESTLGYSTIDFIRTYALNKSSTTPHGGELPLPGHAQLHQHAHEAEELRITRHSKCVRKAYSISE